MAETTLHALVAEAGALISDRARLRLEVAVKSIVSTHAELALESHLDELGDRVDLVARLSPADRDRLLASNPTAPWTDFFRTWASSPSLAGLPYVELELDLVDDVERPPWIGPCVEPLIKCGARAIDRSHDDPSPLTWPSFTHARAVLEELGARDVAWAERLESCFRILPRGGFINHLTWLGARPTNAGASAIHFIASLPSRDALTYLRDVGWEGDFTALRALLVRYRPGAARVQLDVDADLAGAAARTAFYAGFPAPRIDDTELRILLEKLIADGLIPPGKAHGLAGWIRQSQGNDHRMLTLKIGLRADGSHFAKAYLEATHA